MIQLESNFYKQASVEGGKGRISVRKAIIDVHPSLKPGSIVNVKKLELTELSTSAHTFASKLDITFKD